MEVPDHSTVAEFRRRHQDRIAELLVEVLALCQEAGLVRVGEIAIDGTKMRASASYDRNCGYASIVEEILDEAEQADRAEDERHGDGRGDELREQFRTREARRAALQAARERIQAEREARQEASTTGVAARGPPCARATARSRCPRDPPRARGADRGGQRRLDEELAFAHAANRVLGAASRRRADAQRVGGSAPHRTPTGSRWCRRGRSTRPTQTPE
jgi:hypothetical protein